MSDRRELEQYRALARAWLAENLPVRDSRAPTRGDVSPDEVAAARAVQRKVYEAGYLGINVPEQYGGQGLTGEHQRIWNEESAGYAVPMPGGVASGVTLGVVLPTLLAHAGEDQKRAWIP